MKKRIILMMIMAVMVLALCACGNQNIDNTNTTGSTAEPVESQTQEPEHIEEISIEMSEENTEESAEETTEETTEESVEEFAEESSEETTEESAEESAEEEQTSVSDDETNSGADVVEVVNLRGDTTTIYKLVDGRYMDRINRVFIFDGTDTWTDDSGVEWNEIVK